MKTAWRHLALMLALVISHPAAAAPRGARPRVESRDELGRTPLMLAARAGDLAEVRRLVRAGAALESRSRGRWTPLMYAVSRKHLDVVRYLLARGANPRVRGKERTSPLWSAWERSDGLLLEALVRAGAEINDPRDDFLGAAISVDSLELTDILLRLGARPEGLHPLDRPLERAIQRRNGHGFAQIPKIVGLVLTAGAKPRTSDLALATYVEQHDAERPITELLLKAGVEVNGANSWGWTPLHRVALAGDGRMAERLLDAGAKLELQDDSRRTPLDLAIQGGHLGTVELLVRRGANVQPQPGRDPLSRAAVGGHAEIVRVLRAAGSKPGQHAPEDLSQSARRLNLVAVKLFLDIGVDPNFESDGWTALGLALGATQVMNPNGGYADPETLREPTIAMIKLLLPKLHQAAKDDALLHAVVGQKVEILQMLVDAGANPDAPRKFGTAREYAKFNDDPAVAAWMRAR